MIKKQSQNIINDIIKSNELFTDMLNQYIDVYTDGSAINNGKLNCNAGIGIYFNYNDKEYNHSENIQKKFNFVSNNVAELYACIKAIDLIQQLKIKQKIRIHSDSNYVINSMTKWAQKWQQNNWTKSDRQGKQKEIKNKELIQQLYEYTNKYNIIYIHVKSHQKQQKIDENSYEYLKWKGNDMADKNAKKSLQMI